MAGSVILTSISQLQEQRKGFEAISITNFDTVDTTAPQIALGSRIEIAGSVVQFTANETLLGFAGLGAGVCYAYIDGVALTANWTATAPTWSTEKQGYYDATGANRYFMRCVKDAGGNYLQKALYTNIRGILRTYTGLALNPLANGDQELRFASDASILWDESEDRIVLDKILRSDFEYATNTGILIATKTDLGSLDFYIKKPISAFLDYVVAAGTLRFYIYQFAAWREIFSVAAAATSQEFNLQLNPGYYRINFSTTHGSNLCKLYSTGVFSRPTIVAAEIAV
jgi:hypothetical protein